jgi:hypothetical protein
LGETRRTASLLLWQNFRRRAVVSSIASQSSRFERLPNKLLVPVQVLTGNWQLRTNNCF